MSVNLILAGILAALVQSALVQLNWVLMLVLTVSLIKKEKESLVYSFVVGLILDLVLGTRLGLSSLGFLMISFLVLFAREQLQILKLPLLLLLTFLIDFFFHFLIFGRQQLFRSLAFAFVFGLVYYWFLAPRIKRSLGLKLDLD
jgi:rod shape-determining protein MreD